MRVVATERTSRTNTTHSIANSLVCLSFDIAYSYSLTHSLTQLCIRRNGSKRSKSKTRRRLQRELSKSLLLEWSMLSVGRDDRRHVFACLLASRDLIRRTQICREISSQQQRCIGISANSQSAWREQFTALEFSFGLLLYLSVSLSHLSGDDIELVKTTPSAPRQRQHQVQTRLCRGRQHGRHWLLFVSFQSSGVSSTTNVPLLPNVMQDDDCGCGGGRRQCGKKCISRASGPTPVGQNRIRCGRTGCCRLLSSSSQSLMSATNQLTDCHCRRRRLLSGRCVR